jgi:DNA-directed RNA polymerase subunit RPC12/RpoP
MSTEAKCRCQLCNGHIAFDATMAGQEIACPHCGMETKLFIPYAPPAPVTVLPPAPPAPIAAENKPPSVSVAVNLEVKRGVSPMGIASLVLGIMACVICWIPFFGLLAIPLALIGLVFAFVGVIMAGVSKKTGFVFPVSGGFVCILSVCIALAATGGFAKLITTAMDESKKTSQTSASTSTDSDKVDWSTSRDASQGDAKIIVLNSSVGPVVTGYDTYGTLRSDPYLRVKLQIGNLSKTSKIDFTTWRYRQFDFAPEHATLSDNFGNHYKPILLDSSSITVEGDSVPLPHYAYKDEATIYPNDATFDLLLFQVPVNGYKWLHLELPAKNFGGTGVIRFQIPAQL